MEEILLAIDDRGYCYYADIVGAFIPACLWIFYNIFLIAVSIYFGNKVTHKNVFSEYFLVWLVCILNLIASVLIIILFFSDYYSDNDHREGTDIRI